MTFAELRRAAVTRHRQLLGCVGLLALLAHGAALAGDYVFDDLHSIAGNTALHDLGEWWRWLSDPTAFSAGAGHMYRPVLLTSFALNLAISPDAWALKAGNVAIHMSVAMLAFGWLRRLSVPRVAAFAGTALFAVHPLLGEAINLTSARSELLLVLGLLLGLRSHFVLLRGTSPLLASAGMLLGAVIACGSKETGVVLPGLLLAQAWLLRREAWQASHWGRAVTGVLPVVLLVIGYLVLRKVLLGEATVTLVGRTGEDPTSGYGRTLGCQLATMGLLLPRALLQMVVPAGLSMDPAVSFRQSFLDPFVLAGWGGVFGLTIAGLWPGALARVRRMGVMLAWATALPWILVPLNMPLAEHRLYGPLLGVVVVVAALLPHLRSKPLARMALVARPAFGLLLLAGIGCAATRALEFRDERLLWQHELASRPLSWRAWWGLGTANLRAGDVQAAIEPLARAHEIYPGHFDALRNYAEALVQLPVGKAQTYRALAVTGMMAERAPLDPWARTLVAEANLQAGRATKDGSFFVEAERQALSCLEVASPKGLVYRMAAAARRGMGDLEGALRHLDTSLAQGLDHVSVRLDRVAVLRELGRAGEAKRELLRAQRQAPMDPSVQQALWQSAQPPR
jgi:hypothetical protein